MKKKTIRFSKLVGSLCLISLVLCISVTSTVSAETISHFIDGVPLIEQGNRPWCGPACVVMVLQFWRVNITLEEAGKALDKQEDGCYTYELIAYLGRFEFGVYELKNCFISDLKWWIGIDHPVVVLQWSDESMIYGHFRVVVGFDSQYIYVHDPWGREYYYDYETFLLLWERANNWGVTISPLNVYIRDPINGTVRVGVN